MKCPKCGFEQDEGLPECGRCGIVFAKYLKRLDGAGSDACAPDHASRQGTPERGAGLPAQDTDGGPVTYDEDAVNPIYFGARSLVLLGMLILGLRLMTSSIDDLAESFRFLHLINLPFHEAGHILFRMAGQFMTSLGGSLGQLLMPLVCMITFLLKTGDRFGASVSLWWMGENFFDLAPYIDDANRLVLPLLGGNTGDSSPYGFHDWEYILTETGLVQHSHAIAVSSCAVGTLVILASTAWAGYVLFRQLALIRKARRSGAA